MGPDATGRTNKIQNRLDPLHDDPLDGFTDRISLSESRESGDRQTHATATFRQPFDLLAITNITWQRKKAAEPIPAASSIRGSAGRGEKAF